MNGKLKAIVFVGIFGGFSLAIWAASSAWRRAANDSPQISLPVRERDLGSVRQGDLPLVEFPVHNYGGRRLVVMRRSRRCCRDDQVQTSLVIPPGESAHLIVEADTSRWQGHGSHTEQFTTNDDRLPEFRLTVWADVDLPKQPESGR